MKKIFTLFAAALFAGTTVLAVPAKKEFRTFRQADGSEITLSLSGDEFLHYYITTDGVPVDLGTDGNYRYIQSFTSQKIVLSDVVAKNPEVRSVSEKAFVAELQESGLAEAASEIRMQRAKADYTFQAAQAFPSTGSVKGLVLLVEFKDRQFSIENPKATYEERLNKENLETSELIGSVHDYFTDQSHGLFDMQFDVYGPVQIKGNMADYGANSGSSRDIDAPAMVVDACEALDSEINFKDYDQDGDGLVDLVFVLYAGYGEAQGGNSNTIWPHAFDVRGNYNVRLDGVTIGPYACSCELRGNSGTTIDGIGTFCHEFSHCLGLPDVYDTDGYTGGNGYGMGDYSLMDSGCYNDDGYTPCGYTAYEKMFVGWMEPEELKYTLFDAQLRNTIEYNEAYVIYSGVNRNEYYILENRQKVGWDAHIPGNGLMITHVDFDQKIWDANCPNSTAGEERLQIVPADNKYSSTNQQNDVWPGRLNKTEFTDDSEPAAELHTGGFLGKPVTNIRMEDDIIYFDFMADQIVAPTALYSYYWNESGFTARWTGAPSDEHYTLKVTPVMPIGEENMILSEDFSKFTKGDATTPSNSDISAQLDANMQTTGWSGSKVYHAGGMCKLGLSITAGYLATPDMTFPSKFTLTLDAQDYVTAAGKADGGILYVALCGYDGNGDPQFIKKETIELTPTLTNYVFEFEGGGANQFIEIGNESKRALIDNINIAKQGDQIPEEKVFENITKTDNTGEDGVTTYEVTGLVPNYMYKYTVIAYRGDLVSGESNSVVIETRHHDKGIDAEEAGAAIAVRTAYDGVEILNAEDAMVNIYTIDGKLVTTKRISAEKEYIGLESGLYIVRVNDKAFKVLL